MLSGPSMMVITIPSSVLGVLHDNGFSCGKEFCDVSNRRISWEVVNLE